MLHIIKYANFARGKYNINKKSKSMKRVKSNLWWKGVVLSALLMWMGGAAHAQFLRTSYFMEGSHYRMQLNPALTPSRGFVNIPVLGSLNASVSSSSLGYQDIMDVIDDDGNFYNNPEFLGRLDNNNHVNLSINTDIISAGWFRGRNFWSFNIGLRTDVGVKLTKSMFTFLSEMDQIEDKWRTGNYDISGQELNVNAYTELGVGYARQINDRLTVGGRVKVLLGLGNLDLKFNRVSLNANLPSNEQIQKWQSMTSVDAADIAALKSELESYHADLVLDARLESSFKGLELVETNGYIDDLDFDAGEMGIAGYGFGIDLGASYRLLDNLTVSAAVLDLGFISWSKGSTQIATTGNSGLSVKGSDYTAGIDPNDPAGSLVALQDNLNRFQTEMDNYMNRVSGGDVLDYELLELRKEDVSESRRSRLASTVVLGAEYGFFNNALSVGLLSTTRFVEPKALTELTLSANYRPKNWLNLSMSYSAIQSLGKSFGLGLKLGPVFVGTDYMFLGKNSNSVNAFVGFSVPLGKKRVACCDRM